MTVVILRSEVGRCSCRVECRIDKGLVAVQSIIRVMRSLVNVRLAMNGFEAGDHQTYVAMCSKPCGDGVECVNVFNEGVLRGMWRAAPPMHQALLRLLLGRL